MLGFMFEVNIMTLIHFFLIDMLESEICTQTYVQCSEL